MSPREQCSFGWLRAAQVRFMTLATVCRARPVLLSFRVASLSDSLQALPCVALHRTPSENMPSPCIVPIQSTFNFPV
jgi:hypothetical protein